MVYIVDDSGCGEQFSCVGRFDPCDCSIQGPRDRVELSIYKLELLHYHCGAECLNSKNRCHDREGTRNGMNGA